MAATRLQTAIIVGSNREGRAARLVADWFIGQARQREDMDVEVLDLAEVDLPAAYPGEPGPSVEALLERIGRADAFVVVTPEYNHSFPAGLKQAIDLGREEWFAKPVAFVSYGGASGGLRAVEALRLVFAELHGTTVRNTVSLHRFRELFDDDGQLREPARPNAAASHMLNQLAWWAHALRDARAERAYVS